MTTYEKITNYFNENENIFNYCMEELDSWSGYLGDDRYYDMEMLDEFYHGSDPIEILYRAFYGYDEDNWSTDSHGNREHAQFNPNRDYFRYNGYGNLVSTNYKDYSDYLYNSTIDALCENMEHIDTITDTPELYSLFMELAEVSEDE